MVRKAKSDSLSKKAYKFRIYPSEEQKIFFAKTFGCTRFIYFTVNKKAEVLTSAFCM